jgi:hypothetical protein
VEFVEQVWQRAWARTPVPGPEIVLLVGAVALAAVLVAWPLVRIVTTVCHEAGHAVVATLVGRRLRGIRVHSDTSGLTVSSGRPSGPGMVATLFAGYPAPAAVGLGAAWLAGAGYAVALLVLLVVLLALMLLKLRNLYGALVVFLLGCLVAVGSWFATPTVAAWIAHGIAWLLLLAAPRPVIELLASRPAGSDAAQLAALTPVPRVLWSLLWLALTLGALVLGASWLLAVGGPS